MYFFKISIKYIFWIIKKNYLPFEKHYISFTLYGVIQLKKLILTCNSLKFFYLAGKMKLIRDK